MAWTNPFRDDRTNLRPVPRSVHSPLRPNADDGRAPDNPHALARLRRGERPDAGRRDRRASSRSRPNLRVLPKARATMRKFFRLRPDARLALRCVIRNSPRRPRITHSWLAWLAWL